MNRVRWFFVWILRAVVFILLFGLALKNSEPVDLNFFFNLHWRIPLDVVVLASVGVGAVLGLSAVFSRSTRSGGS